MLEPHEEPPGLLALHANLSAALLALGLEPEARKFRPHVTLARRANSVVVPPEADKLVWNIGGYALVESKPGNGGAAWRRTRCSPRWPTGSSASSTCRIPSTRSPRG